MALIRICKTLKYFKKGSTMKKFSELIEAYNIDLEIKKAQELKAKELKKIYKNKNENIVVRLAAWLESPKKKFLHTLINEGPLSDMIENENDLERYQQIDVPDAIYYWLLDKYDIDIRYLVVSNSPIPAEKKIECIEKFIKKYEKLSEDDKEKIKNIIEDAINQNIGEYTVDW
jgi:hypothetical protein